MFARIILAGALALCSAAAQSADAPHWQPWTNDLFAQARRQHRFVLLDLEAVWCHWCHVMDETTYRDPAVLKLLESHYLSVRVDQDARPDLSNHYEDYGWPATVVFDENGQEIVKRQGYMPPREMAGMLEAIVKDPSPGPSVQPEPKVNFSGTSALDPAVRAELIKANDDGYDNAAGGWGHEHKYVDGESLDYEFERTQAGDAEAERRLRQTLTAALKLIDPVWGGAWQYSVDGNWNEPHYEKIMSIQTDNMRLYALAGAAWHVPDYEKAALDIQRYVAGFLTSPDGAFYVSQDADLVPGEQSASYFALDDAARRRRGIPRVDEHVYARENGWMIESLAALYGATGRDEFLLEAVRAADWVVQNRALPGGGFRHDASDAYGPYLGDTLAMGRAFLALYAATADRHWLERARQAASFVGANFADASGAGFDTTGHSASPASRPRPERDENISLARFANLLFQYTGDEQPRMMAERAMKYLVTPEVARRLPAAGVLLADAEFGRAPLHITIVGHKDDAAARGLFLTALSAPSLYKRVEWWDAREGALPNPDVEYPEMKRAAAFLCTEGRCSMPSFDTVRFAATIERARNSH